MQTLVKRPNGHNGIPGVYKAVGERKADTYKKEAPYGHASMRKDPRYTEEILDTMRKIVGTMPAYKEFVFFVKVVRDHYLADFENGSPQIIVLGSNIPEELVFASGIAPYWVLGGGRSSSMWADDLVPRDTDPVSRSGLGYLKSGFAKRALILLPLVCDSSRKLAYILKTMGLKVHTFHFPPVKNEDSIEEWNRQYEACRLAVARHLKRPLTERALEKSREQIRQAKLKIHVFIQASEGILSGSLRMFILGSYYCMDNFAEWCSQLECLTARLRKEKQAHPAGYYKSIGKNRVLLLGSPVYFPNYKIPFLIEETGMEICLQADYTTSQIQSVPNWEGGFADVFYSNDVSPAYVRNDSLYKLAVKMVSGQKVEGIVYHVLKGQIEYDFELGRLEDAFGKMDIPVFRLETDYNYQDVEQLRIRLEAFSEVLQQKNYGGKAI